MAGRTASSRLVKHRFCDGGQISALHWGLNVLTHVQNLLGDHFEEFGALDDEMMLLRGRIGEIAELHGEVVVPLDEFGENGEGGGGVVVIDEDVDEELGDGEDVLEEIENLLLHGEKRRFATNQRGIGVETL